MDSSQHSGSARSRCWLELLIDRWKDDDVSISSLASLLENTEFRRIEIPPPSLVIGRSTFKDVAEVLREDTWFKRLSRSHFMIDIRPKNGSSLLDDEETEVENWLTDTSVNGTFLNGRLIGLNKSIKLKDHDTIGVLQCQGDPRKFNLEYEFRTLPQIHASPHR